MTPILDHGTVVNVLAGDTLELNDGRIIRLVGLRTYEPFFLGWVDKVNPSRLLYAQLALKRTRELTYKREIKLDFPLDIPSPPNISPAYVYLEDGRCLNEILLKEGLAQIIIGTPEHPKSSHFEKLQKEAYENNKGIWSVDYASINVTIKPEKPKFEIDDTELDYSSFYKEKESEQSSKKLRGIISIIIIIILIGGVLFAVYILKATKICPMCNYANVPKKSDICPNCNYNFRTGYLGDAELHTWVTKNIRVVKKTPPKRRRKR